MTTKLKVGDVVKVFTYKGSASTPFVAKVVRVDASGVVVETDEIRQGVHPIQCRKIK